MFTVDSDGVAETTVTGLAWRGEVCQQVFEEAAVDLGRGLAAWSDSRSGKRKGRRVGFPAVQEEDRRYPVVSAAQQTPQGHDQRRSGSATTTGPRSVTLPGIGAIGVHDDTRRLRRMLAKERAKILFATVSHHGGPVVGLAERRGRRPAPSPPAPAARPRPIDGGWVGVDRGLSAFLVAATADGTEVARIGDAPKALAAGMTRQRRLGEIVVAQEERITQPQGGRRQAGAASPPCRQCAPAFPAPGIRRAGQDPRPARHRGPERGGNAGQPPAGPRDLGCAAGRSSPACSPTSRSGAAGSSSKPTAGIPSTRLCPAMRGHRHRDDAGGSGVHLWVRAYRRPRHQRRDESGPVGPHPSRPPSIPGPPSRRPGHQRPPTGRRWPTPLVCW